MLTDLEKNAIRDHYQNIAQSLPQFRPRAAQRTMLAEIAKAFSRSRVYTGDKNDLPDREGESIAVIEGPTGVGKSLAYLLAGGIMAQTRNKKLVVSSATIALQEQLVGRDLPFLVEHSGLQLSFALAKGRGRYLCPYKLFRLTRDHAQENLAGFDALAGLWESKPKPEVMSVLRQLADAFEARTFDGDRDNWPEEISGEVWGKITNDRHGCLKAACPNRPECPFFLARETLDTVDVVVTNHDLLLSDIAMGGGVVLPAPADSFYCIDEAHHLAKKALGRLAEEHSLTQAMWFLERVGGIAEKAAAAADKPGAAAAISETAAALADQLREWEFYLSESLVSDPDDRHNDPILAWPDGIVPDNLVLQVAGTAKNSATLNKLLNNLTEALSAARRENKGESVGAEQIAVELGMMAARAEQIAGVWELMQTRTAENEAPLAKWFSCQTGEKHDYGFHASPITCAARLTSGLWRRAAGAVLTSATLRSLGSFDLLLSQTGLKYLPETTTMALESPFDFARQGELYIPAMTAGPKEAAAHTAEIAARLPQLADTSEPVGTLVLFSSRRQMNDVAALLPESYRSILKIQGALPKNILLERHRQDIAAGQASIIFGLDSFAEGLDLPGDTCVQVIIAKLPFSMPDNPIEKAQSRWIEQRGGNPFMELTVPEAGIKLIQAVGRLIRTETDYGRVTILDHRIVTARYGKLLLASLPDFTRVG